MKSGGWRLGALIALLAAVLRLHVTLGLAAQLTPDSARYWTAVGPLATAPEILVPWLLRPARDLVGITTIQAALGSLCWGALIVTVSAAAPRRSIGLIAAAAVAILSLCRPIVSWDVVLLSESITLSLSAVWAMGVVIALRWQRLSPVLVASTVLVAAHPQDAPVVVPAALALVLTAHLEWRRAAALCLVAAVPLIWAVMAENHFESGTGGNGSMSTEFERAIGGSGLTVRGWYALTRLAELGTDPRYQELAQVAGEPECASLNAALTAYRESGGILHPPYHFCPSAAAWLNRGGVGPWSIWLDHPSLALGLAVPRLGLALYPALRSGVGVPVDVSTLLLLAVPGVITAVLVRRVGIVLLSLVLSGTALTMVAVIADASDAGRHVFHYVALAIVLAGVLPAVWPIPADHAAQTSMTTGPVPLTLTAVPPA